MILGVELFLLGYGVYVLIKGKFEIGKNRIIIGSNARILGFICLMPIPISMSIGFYVGANEDRFKGGLPNPVIIGVAVVLSILILIGLLGAIFYKAQKNQKV